MGANDKVAATFYDPASGESEYVPTVEFARGAYIYDRTTLGVITAKQAQAEFNRMIAKVRAEAKAEALEEAVNELGAWGTECIPAARALSVRANQYRVGSE